MEFINCKVVNWGEIEDWTESVAASIKQSGYSPDMCIGMTRGGWVPSRLICDHLGIKDLHAVKTEHWGITATKNGEARLAQPLAIEVEDKKVLIVDDITDTGQSLRLALEHVKERGAKNVISATLLHITHSKVTPDFYAVEVPATEWTWFIFPWNFNEDIQSLVNKTLDDGDRADMEIVDLLKKHCSINVDHKIVKNTLVELENNMQVEKIGEKWARKK
jgi:hypoxanthine phosphoribosyltransferase